MAIEIRSYRSVFELERRIYRVDRVRLNPGGVPLRGVAYFLVLLLAALVMGVLPLVGALERVLPWYVRDLALPACGAALLTTVRIDGRPFHLAAGAFIGYAKGPSRTLGGGSGVLPGACWRPRELVMFPDGSEGRLRKMLCSGPAEVRVAVAHERVEWRHDPLGRLARREGVMVRELRGRRRPRHPQVIALRAGARLRVR